MSLTYDFGVLKDWIVSSGERWTQSALENDWYFSVAAIDLGRLSDDKIKEYGPNYSSTRSF